MENKNYEILKVDVRKRGYINHTHRQTTSPSKMFIFIENETLIDDLTKRYNRPYQFYKKEIIPQIVEIIKSQQLIKTSEEEEIIDLSKCTFSWNQRAGCSCGCSPGFIIKEFIGHDIYVNIKCFKDENKIVI